MLFPFDLQDISRFTSLISFNIQEKLNDNLDYIRYVLVFLQRKWEFTFANIHLNYYNKGLNKTIYIFFGGTSFTEEH